MIDDNKERRYNLYYILSDRIENEKIPFSLYCNMLCYIMERIEGNQRKEKEDEDEKRRFDQNSKSSTK